MKIVLDTSVLLKLYISEIDSDLAKEIMWAVDRGQIEAHVPTLVRYELLNSLIKGLNSATETASHFRHFNSLVHGGFIIEHAAKLKYSLAANEMSFWDTESQGHISSYDASFHVLAIEIGATFVTADKAHIRRTKDQFGSVCSLNSFDISS